MGLGHCCCCSCQYTNAAVPTTIAGSACGLVIRVVTDTACGTGGARPSSSTRLRRFARGRRDARNVNVGCTAAAAASSRKSSTFSTSSLLPQLLHPPSYLPVFHCYSYCYLCLPCSIAAMSTVAANPAPNGERGWWVLLLLLLLLVHHTHALVLALVRS